MDFSPEQRKYPESRPIKQADMAELADAPDLGSGGIPVQVRLLLSADPVFWAFSGLDDLAVESAKTRGRDITGFRKG